jgi:bifunctional non-homologous end joining protein LigD
MVANYKHACKVGLEGVVSKVRNSIYASGRINDWLKKTCVQRETLTIAGFTLDGNDWDGIYVGRRKGKDLIYAGKVDHGFDKTSATELRKRLTPLIRKTQPYAKRIAHKGIWVKPELMAEIEYRAKSAEGKMRHPFFKGLREDLCLCWTSHGRQPNGKYLGTDADRVFKTEADHHVNCPGCEQWFDLRDLA